MATGTTKMPEADKSSFREEHCPSHVEVEWDVSYETLQKFGDDALRSPVFKIGRQSYMLESKQRSIDNVKLSLLRMGPSISDRPFTGQLWGGLKRTDGNYDLMYESEQSDIKYESRSFEIENSFWITPKTDLYRLYVTTDGCLKFFLRMNIKRPLVGVETCTHSTPRMPYPEEGSIRQEECSCHQHVEWNIKYEIQKEHGDESTSPVFKIGTQMYFFKLINIVDIYYCKIFLYRIGHSVDGPAADVRYWIGLKRLDGTYDHENISDKLDLNEELSLWTLAAERYFLCSKIGKQYLKLDRHLTFFFRLNAVSTGADLCRHGTPDQIAPQAAGNIREEQCFSHKQIEWDIGYKVTQDDTINLTSPVFKIGTQVYFLETSFETHGGVGLHLFTRGRSAGGPASTPRCWAGLKRADGTYRYDIVSKQVDLREDYWFWTHLDYLMYIWAFDVKEQYLTPDSRLTFLFRMNTETNGPQMCTHGTIEMPSSVTGRIQEAECSSHKEVEWDIDCEALLENKLPLISPAFKIDTQMYYLELAGNISHSASFGLYRLGRSVKGPASSVRCWAGLKYLDGTYPFRTFSVKFDLQDDFELWTLVTSLMNFPNFSLFKNDLKNIRRLIFFIRMNVEPTGTEKCIHGPIDGYALSGEGNIQIQNCPAHNHVLWDLAYDMSQKNACSSASPVFKVGNQLYYLNVRYDPEEPVTLELYRSGYSVQGKDSSVRCWAGLKSGDGTYHHHTQKLEIDLREEFLLLTHVASFLFPHRSDLERTHVTSEGHLTFWLQLNVPQVTVDEVTCVHGPVEMCPPGEGSIREKKHNLVEWHVGYEEPREYTYFSTSPVFKIGVQFYLLELCYETDGILALCLYRAGRSVEGPAGSVRCWAGLKRDSGMYHHNVEGVEFDLRRDCELWTKVKILCYFRRYVLESECLTKDGRLTFFFLVSAEGREAKGVAVQTDEKAKGGHQERFSQHPEAEQTDGNEKGGHEKRFAQHSKSVAVQTDGNAKGGHEERFSQNSEDFKELRQDFKLWLEHPEEGDRIRRRHMEEFETKRWNVLEEQPKEDKEPSIFAA